MPHLKFGKFAMFSSTTPVPCLAMVAISLAMALVLGPLQTHSIILPRLMPFFYQPFVTEPSHFSSSSLLSSLVAPPSHLSQSPSSASLSQHHSSGIQYPAIHSQPDYQYNWNQYIQSQNPGVLYPGSTTGSNNYHPNIIQHQQPSLISSTPPSIFGSLFRKPWISWKLGKFGLRPNSKSTSNICGPGSGGFTGSTSSVIFPSSSLVQSLIGGGSSAPTLSYPRPSNYPCYNPCCYYHPSGGTGYAGSSSNQDYIQTTVNDNPGSISGSSGISSNDPYSYPVGGYHHAESNSPLTYPNNRPTNYIYYSPDSITSGTNSGNDNSSRSSSRISYKPAQLSSLSSPDDHSGYLSSKASEHNQIDLTSS